MHADYAVCADYVVCVQFQVVEEVEGFECELVEEEDNVVEEVEEELEVKMDEQPEDFHLHSPVNRFPA